MNQLNDDGTCCKHCKDCITFNYERIGENGKKQNFVYCYGGMDRVHDAKWYIDNSGYARSTNKINNGKAVLFHTFFKKNEWNVIDHINGYRNDNRLCNLRECTLLQNMHNLHTDKHSEFPGVMFNKRTKKWYAVTQVKAVRGVKQFGTYGYFGKDAYQYCHFLKCKEKNVVAFTMKNVRADETYEQLFVAYNANKKEVKINLPDGETYVLLADESSATREKEGKEIKDFVLLKPQSAMICGKPQQKN